MSFFSELKRRNVFKVGVVYAIVAWLIAQIVSVIQNPLHLPDGFDTAVIVLLIVGFPLALIFAWAFELTPEGIRPSKDIDQAKSISHITGQKLNYSIIALLSLAVAFLVLDNYVLDSGTRDSGLGNRQEQISNTNTDKGTVTNDQGLKANNIGQVTSDKVEPSIAVLPFADLSPKKDQGYFADGIAEQLLDQLAKVHGLLVAGRTSSFYFKDRHESFQVIGKKLGVDHILEGSVRKAGNRVRITTQLINAADGYHLWSETYDRTLDDIFAIQDDIAKSVANALQISLGVGELGREPGMTHNVTAYDTYLAGHSLMRNLTRDNLSQAIEQFERAVALDPGFAVAWNELAGSYSYAIAFFSERAVEFTQKTQAAASRAIALAPESLSSLLAAAQQDSQHREWSAAEQSLVKALALAPGDYQPTIRYSIFLLTVGRPRKAVEYIKRAIRAEPLFVIPARILGLAYEMSGNIDAARNQYEQAKKLAVVDTSVMDTFILFLAMATDNRDLVNTYLDKVINSGMLSPDGLSLTRSLLEKPDEARSVLHRFFQDTALNKNHMTFNFLGIYASYLDDPALALKAFQKASRLTGFTPMYFWLAVLKEMRRQPGFKNIVKDLGLVDYWRRSGDWGEFCHPVGEGNFECK